MKIAIFSDIHGNAAALEAALSGAKREGAEHLLLAGDYVGYYFKPAAVFDMLGTWPRTIVKGNHDAMLGEIRAGRLDPAVPLGKYGPGLDIALRDLSTDQLDQIDALPHPTRVEIGGRDVLLCHGTPWDRDEYVYPDADPDLLLRCSMHAKDLVILGHTHHPLSFVEGRAVVHNPGSVGQPRNRVPGAHWTLYDTGAHTLSTFCEDYDINLLRAECAEICPSLPFLADVLVRR